MKINTLFPSTGPSDMSLQITKYKRLYTYEERHIGITLF